MCRLTSLLLSFGRLRLWLGHFEPAHRHMYQLDDEGIGTLGKAPGGLTSGVFGAAEGGMMTGAVITHKMLSSTFLATDTMAFRAAVGTLCTYSFSYSIACPCPHPLASWLGLSSPRRVSPAWTLGACDVPTLPLWAFPTPPIPEPTSLPAHNYHNYGWPPSTACF